MNWALNGDLHIVQFIVRTIFSLRKGTLTLALTQV